MMPPDMYKDKGKRHDVMDASAAGRKVHVPHGNVRLRDSIIISWGYTSSKALQLVATYPRESKSETQERIFESMISCNRRLFCRT